MLGRTSRRINPLSSRIFISVQSWKSKISELGATYFILFKKYSKTYVSHDDTSKLHGWLIMCVSMYQRLQCVGIYKLDFVEGSVGVRVSSCPRIATFTA